MTRRNEKDADRIVDNVLDALDDEPVTDAEVRETLAELGYDAKSGAASMRAHIEARLKEERRTRLAEAENRRLIEVARVQNLPAEPVLPRHEQIAVLKGLIGRAGPQVAVHFMKYESATPEELARMVAELRYLLEDEDGDGED